MTKIQNTIQYEPLIPQIKIERKSGKLLSTYFINVGGTPTYFQGYYFVPTYDELRGDDSIIKFTASFAATYYATNYPVQCEWDFGDGNKILVLDREKNKKALASGSYPSVYHKFTKGGPSINNQPIAVDQTVTFTVIDKVGRKTVVSTKVYPKSGS